jgi:hypothetical protein
MLVADKGNHEAVGAGPPGPARAVHVVGVVRGRVEVDDQGYRIDVDAARGDVRRDEHIESAGAEGG